MRRMLLTQMLLAAPLMGGCALYLHDAERFTQAKDARSLVESATKGSDDMWTNMVANLEAFEPAERAAIERAVSQISVTERRLIYTWSWEKLREAAQAVIQEDEAEINEIAKEILALRAQAQMVRTQLKDVIFPQLIAGKREPVDESPIKETLKALGLEKVVEEIDEELSEAWPDLSDAKGLDEILKRMGLSDTERKALLEKKMDMKLSDRLPHLLSGIDKIVNRTTSLAKAVGSLRKVLRATDEEGWPLDETIRLLRNAKDLDLIQEIRNLLGKQLPDGTLQVPNDLKLTGEAQKAIGRAVAILEKEKVQKAIQTVGELRQILSRFDTKGDVVLRRFQRDILVTKSELLQAELAFVEQKMSLPQERTAILRGRMKAAQDILTFVEGPYPNELGRRIQEARNQLGLTVEELARELGITSTLIPRWEKGDYMPSELEQIT